MPRSPSRNARSTARAGRTFAGASGGDGGGGGGPTFTPSVVGALASSEANAGNAAANAIDTDDTSKWTAAASTGWLRLQLALAGPVTGYRVTPSPGELNFAPKSWTLEGSNDGSSWTVVDTRANFTAWANSASPTFTFANSTDYLYYRLNVSANSGGALVAVADLRPTPATGIALLGGNGGTMLEWWDASTITGKTDGASVAFGDMTDQAGRHNFTNTIGTVTYRATGGPNSKPALESAVTGAGFYRLPSSAQPTADCTIFVVGKLLSTTNQQLFGGGAGGPCVDVQSNKFRFLKQGQTQIAVSTTSHPTSAWFIVIVTYTSATGSTKFRIIQSGSDVTDTISGTATTFSTTANTFGWGAYDTSTGAALQGSAAEMGRYASALDSTDTATLADALKTKYGF